MHRGISGLCQRTEASSPGRDRQNEPTNARSVEADDQSKQKSKMVDKMQGMMKEVQNRLQQTQDVHRKVEQL